MRPYKDIPKSQRNYDYKSKPETPVVLKDLKGLLGEMYGDTYKGPHVYVTHKQAFEARVTKRLANTESMIDTIESLPNWPVWAHESLPTDPS